MDPVCVKLQPSQRYVSRSRQLRAEAIDAYVRETIAELRREFEPSGPPFTYYHGCSKEDEQIVEVCLPTEAGNAKTARQEIAFTVARGNECEYPQILAGYDAVVAYAKASGLELDGLPRETYLTEPGSSEAELEISYPLAKRTEMRA